MEFNPSNHVIKLCVQGMGLEEKGKPEEASRIFLHPKKPPKNLRS